MNQSNDHSDSAAQPRKRWVRWRYLALLVLLLTAIAGGTVWWSFDGYVRSQLTDQLSELGMGTPEIDSISASQSGIRASGIRFFQSDDDSQPWLSLDELVIDHPLSSLISGTDQFNAIELNGAQLDFDLDQVQTSSDGFGLKGIELPAKEIRIRDAQVTLRSDQKPDFTIGSFDGTLQGEDSLQWEGTIGEMAGGSWKTSASINPKTGKLDATLESSSLNLKTEAWSQWPMVPDGMDSIATADGDVAATVEIRINDDSDLQINGSVEIQDLAVRFPEFDLPVNLSQGNVAFDQQQVRYRDLQGSLADGGTLTAEGATDISVWPLETEFDAKFEGVQVATWRRLVEPIPAEVSGTTAGTLSGTFWLEESTRARIQIQADAVASRGSYGKIEMRTADVDVQLDELIFDERQQFESVEGLVVVDAAMVQQDMRSVFETFEIDFVREQLSLAGRGDGRLHLELPMATAEDLETWTLNVSATLPDALIGGQPVKQVAVESSLDRGDLVLSPVTSTAVVDPSIDTTLPVGNLRQQVSATVRWPLTETAPSSNNGKVTIDTQDVAAGWITRVIDRLVANAYAEQLPVESTRDQLPLSGSVSSRTTLSIPVAAPAEIDGWTADSTVSKSTVGFSDVQVDNLESNIRLEKSQLQITNVSGRWLNRAEISGSGSIDLQRPDSIRLTLNSNQTPMDRAIDSFAELATDDALSSIPELESAREWLSRVGEQKIRGDADLALRFQNDPNDVDEDSADKTLQIDASSRSLSIDQDQLSDIVVAMEIDQQRLQIDTLRATLNERGNLQGQGSWSFEDKTGQGKVSWRQVPVAWLAQISGMSIESVQGEVDGELSLVPIEPDDDPSALPVAVNGQVTLRDARLNEFELSRLAFDIRTNNQQIEISNVRNGDGSIALDAGASINLKSPYAYQVNGQMNGLALSKLVESSSVLEEEDRIELTGTVAGKWSVSGDLQPFRWKTDGDVTIYNPTVDQHAIGDVIARWSHLGSDWKQSRLSLQALGGEIKMVELSSEPQRIRVELRDLDAERLSKALDLPAQVTGIVSGDASLNDWSLTETRWVDMNLNSSSLVVGPAEFGDFRGGAVYRDQKLTYQVNGALLSGKLDGVGEVQLDQGMEQINELPMQIKLTNASLAALYGESNYFRSLRPLKGTLAATADVQFLFDAAPTATGRIQVGDLKWDNADLTREASVRFSIAEDRILLDDVRADLKRGQIAARLNIPLREGAARNFEIDIRQLDLQRLTEVLGYEALEAEGLVDTRLSGQLGRRWSGMGYVGVDRASLHGVSGQSARIPIQIEFSPQDQSGHVELRRTRFRFLDGSVNGSAAFDFGRRLNLETDLQFSNVNSGDLIKTLFDVDDLDQGRLRGRLQLKGTGIQSARDLNGSFTGSLDKAQVFQLPVLEQIGRFLSTGQIMNRDYETDEIDLRLNRGRVEIRQLHFFNSLARVAIDGFVYLDGRLDLGVMARVEQLNQPTLLDELLGSPLAGFRGTPAGFFAQAAEFLSERMVFLRVGGTFDRPQVQLDSGPQLREEAIRYFLQGSGIVPNDLRFDR